MRNNSELGAKILGVIGGVGLIGTVGESSTVFDEVTANISSGNGTSDSTIEMGQSSTEDPNASSGAGLLTTTIGGMQVSSSEPDAILVIFNKDAVPYTKIEKSASKIYHSISNKIDSGKKTAIITKSKKQYTLLERLLYDKSSHLSSDNLDVLERILEQIDK